MDVLYVVIPAYNEAANIRRTVNEWYPVVEKHNEEGLSRLVIINDGSRDQTYDIVIEEKIRMSSRVSGTAALSMTRYSETGLTAGTASQEFWWKEFSASF